MALKGLFVYAELDYHVHFEVTRKMILSFFGHWCKGIKRESAMKALPFLHVDFHKVFLNDKLHLKHRNINLGLLLFYLTFADIRSPFKLVFLLGFLVYHLAVRFQNFRAKSF